MSLVAYSIRSVLLLFHIVLIASCTISANQPASKSWYVAYKHVNVDSIIQFAIEN